MKRWRALLVVVLVAAFLRGWAVLTLPADYDEPTYLLAGYHYADALRGGDLNAIVNYPENREHPALPKLLYGMLIAARGRGVPINEGLVIARLWSALLGVIACLLLALYDPIAGGLLAVHTMAVKYTAEVYLEAVPALASLAAVLAMVSSRGQRDRRVADRWFWLSAFALGVTAAGKLTYAPVVAAILYLAWEKRIRWHHVLLYAALAAATMFALDPTLWNHPLQRLMDMLFFHVSYSQGRVVESAGYPWYQPLVWLTTSAPAEWHPATFFYYGFDGLIFWLAIFGLRREWRQRRWLVAWIVTGVIVLLAWPTKWPQYTLSITPALCMAAGASLRDAYRWLRANEDRWDWIKPLVPRVSQFLWIGIGVVLVGILVWYAIDRADMAAGQRGWTEVKEPYYDLPGSTVTAVAGLPDGRVLLGTPDGLYVWTPPATEGEPGKVAPFSANAAACRPVTALLVDGDGTVWCGTETGVVRLQASGGAAEMYDAAALGLPSAHISAFTRDPGGAMWTVATTGAAQYAEGRWQPLKGSDELGPITAVAATEDAVWLGTQQGLVAVDRATGEQSRFDRTNSGLASDAISALAVDGRGTVWAATLGGGLSAWDGAHWRTYLTTNSDLPLNTVSALDAGQDGLWVGAAFASQPGGLLSRYDGKEWVTFFPVRTGYSGSEPLAITEDADGALWVGTRTAGAHRFDQTPGE
jgi:hypothetical protein